MGKVGASTNQSLHFDSSSAAGECSSEPLTSSQPRQSSGLNAEPPAADAFSQRQLDSAKGERMSRFIQTQTATGDAARSGGMSVADLQCGGIQPQSCGDEPNQSSLLQSSAETQASAESAAAQSPAAESAAAQAAAALAKPYSPTEGMNPLQKFAHDVDVNPESMRLVADHLMVGSLALLGGSLAVATGGASNALLASVSSSAVSGATAGGVAPLAKDLVNGTELGTKKAIEGAFIGGVAGANAGLVSFGLAGAPLATAASNAMHGALSAMPTDSNMIAGGVAGMMSTSHPAGVAGNILLQAAASIAD